jgi:hypothetical protein
MKVRNLWVAAASAGMIVGAADAQAGTAATGSSSVFSASTTGIVTGNFSDVPTPFSGGPGLGTFGDYNPLSGYASLAGVSFSTPNSLGNVNVNSAFFYSASDLPAPYAVNSVYSGSAPDILTITLPSAETAFYLDFTTLFTSTTATFDLSNAFSTTVSPTVAYPNTPEFLGFVSSAPFTTITLTVPSQLSWVVADFGYGSWNGVSAVPETSTWAMLLIGFCGLGYISCRRQLSRRVSA